jgi:hypothetical protein
MLSSTTLVSKSFIQPINQSINQSAASSDNSMINDVCMLTDSVVTHTPSSISAIRGGGATAKSFAPSNGGKASFTPGGSSGSGSGSSSSSRQLGSTPSASFGARSIPSSSTPQK